MNNDFNILHDRNKCQNSYRANHWPAMRSEERPNVTKDLKKGLGDPAQKRKQGRNGLERCRRKSPAQPQKTSKRGPADQWGPTGRILERFNRETIRKM